MSGCENCNCTMCRENKEENSETITISKDEYDYLYEEISFLTCLRAAGVDNWEGWDDACQMYREMEDEADKTEEDNE